MSCHKSGFKHLCKSTECTYNTLNDLKSSLSFSVINREIQNTLCSSFHSPTQSIRIIRITHSSITTIPSHSTTITTVSTIPTISHTAHATHTTHTTIH